MIMQNVKMETGGGKCFPGASNANIILLEKGKVVMHSSLHFLYK